MVLALFLKENITSRSHTGVRKQFGSYFIKTGKLSLEDGKTFSLLFDQRHKSDYEDFIKLSKEQSNMLTGMVNEFLHHLEEKIKD